MCVCFISISNFGIFQLGDNVKMPITGLDRDGQKQTETEKTDKTETGRQSKRQQRKTRDSQGYRDKETYRKTNTPA